MRRFVRDEAGGLAVDLGLALTFFLLPFLLVLFQLAMVIVERIDTQRAHGIVASRIRDGLHRPAPGRPPWSMDNVATNICAARLTPGTCRVRIIGFRADSFADFAGLAANVPVRTAVLANEIAFDANAPYLRLEVEHSSDWLSFWRTSDSFQSAFSPLIRWRVVNLMVVAP